MRQNHLRSSIAGNLAAIAEMEICLRTTFVKSSISVPKGLSATLGALPTISTLSFNPVGAAIGASIVCASTWF